MNYVLVANILTPYRKVFYDELYRQCKANGDNFHVLVMANTEPGRHWNYCDFATEYTCLLPGKLINIKNIYTIINWNLKKKLKELQPDVVIATGSYMITSVWREIYLSQKLGYQIYYWSESHDDEVRQYNSKVLYLRELFRTQVLKRFDGFWYAGTKSKSLLMKYGKNEAKYIHVPNLVDQDKFQKELSLETKKQLLTQYDIDENKKILICPARLHPAKGILEFLELYSQCKNKGMATILIPGDGELYDEIMRSIKEKNVDVRLLGYKNEKEIIELYSIADIFLLPSKSDPNPLSCIEACWKKLPLLVSRHVGNHPEIVNEGKNGYVFSYELPEESIEKIDTILKADQEWVDSAGNYSYQVAMNTFEPQIQVNRILQEHKNYLGLQK